MRPFSSLLLLSTVLLWAPLSYAATTIHFDGTIKEGVQIDTCTDNILNFAKEKQWTAQKVNHYFEDNVPHMSYKGVEVTVVDNKPTADFLFTPQGELKGGIDTSEYSTDNHIELLNLLGIIKEKCVPTLDISDTTGYLTNQNKEALTKAQNTLQQDTKEAAQNSATKNTLELNMNTLTTGSHTAFFSGLFLSLLLVFILHASLRGHDQRKEK